MTLHVATGLGLVDSALELANLAANSLVLALAPDDSQIKHDVEAEIGQAIDNVKAGARQALASTKKLIVEDPDGMVKLVQVPDQIIINSVRTGLLAIAAPDPEDRARNRAAVYEFAGETVLLAGAAEGGGQAVRIVRRGVRATEELSALAEGMEIVEHTAVSGLRLGVVSQDVVSGETGALVSYDPEFAARQLLGESPLTRGGRTITPHAAGQMVDPPRGRVPMSVEEVDQVLDTATRVRKITPHPEGTTVTVQRPDLPGGPQVVVDAATGKRVVTVIRNKG